MGAICITLIIVGAVGLSSCGTKKGNKSNKNITDDLNLYEYEEGKDQRQEGKVNVEFYPNSKNPQFIIYDSYKITNKDDQRAILEYIMESGFYSQDVYGRSIDSMLIEWDAHNDIYVLSRDERVQHTNFDKNDEKTTYIGYWCRAGIEFMKQHKEWFIYALS